MKKCFMRHIICSLLIFTAISCQDEFMKEEFIGEGMATVSATVDFKPMSSALARTKAAGDALKDIKSLHVLLYNKTGNTLIKAWPISSYKETDVERGATDAENELLAETTTKRATFKLPEAIESGTYYMYAVANIPDLLTDYSEKIKTVDGLKGISLTWNPDNISANGQMIGCFTSASTDTPTTTDSPLILSGDTKPHAWLRRAASKVTVAFDASGLRDSVSIYLKAVRIKNIPMYCKLGEDNTVTKEGEEDAPLIKDGEKVKYSESSSYDENYPALITKHQPYYPKGTKTEETDGTISWTPDPDRHSETHPNSLFFYENMQGEGPDKSAYADSDGDGILDPDTKYNHKEKLYATYIEVDAFYESIHPDRPGMSNITYRFMLGQNVTTDYNAKRNCHYKLTLHFNGFADEPDWRIDYVTRFGTTHPEPVDYRGKYFVPDNVSSNQGNNFSDNNVITVASYMYQIDEWTKRTPLSYKIEYRDAGSQGFTNTLPDWLDPFTDTDKGNGVHELKINYKNPHTSVPINDTLQQRPAKSGIYDLSTKGGTTHMNTANCYIVDSKGTYQFPLVYGNAIVNDGTNETSYKYQAWGTTVNYLKTFLNYNNKPIQSPYILEDIYGTAVPTNLEASLVWQDEKDLVTNITYMPGDHGAIRFEVNNPREGNTVIALKDPSGTIMWSWHIWVTAMDLTRTLTLTNAEVYGSRQFEILPVNLGWCSGNIPVRYYDRHECEVRFTQILEDGKDGMSKTVKIVQEPHIALPCGNNPYYQHGRKDPFMASGGANETNKQWYDASGNPMINTAPPTITNNTPEPEHEALRLKTYKATALLIQNPNKWQNCPHEKNTNPDIAGNYVPKDSIFFNLWDNSCWDDNDDVVKTVYDPCPVGYHVSSIYTFSGFTDYGGSVSGDYSTNTYAVIEENMLNESAYRNNIVEFYTNKTKLISIGFLANGYRDWDDNAKVWQFGQGEVWCAQAVPFDWSPPYNAYHLEFTRLTTGFTPHIFPWNNYYATDGMAVRPTRTLP